MDEASRASVAPASRTKQNLRKAVLVRRDQQPQAQSAHASACLGANLKTLPELLAAKSLAAFWPLPGEVDLRPLLAALYDQGKVIALPVMIDNRLIFRQWHPGSAMQKKAFGVMEPGTDCPVVTPDILLAPLVAFDRKGGRLGYGKGFYDRTLANGPGSGAPMTIGVAFAIQEIDSVPLEPHDQLLDAVVTEAEILRFQR